MVKKVPDQKPKRKLVDLSEVDESLYLKMKAHCIVNKIKIGQFIEEAIREKLEQRCIKNDRN